jgi:RNA polymerase sigma-70 factor, ECF subfamily
MIEATSVSIDSYKMWADLTERIKRGEESAILELYLVFTRKIKYLMRRMLGDEELEDRLHDTFILVIGCIQRGEVREPERLMGFIRAVVQHQTYMYLDHTIRRRANSCLDERTIDERSSPEKLFTERQRAEFARSTMARMKPKDREILTRFYIHEQKEPQIRREMNLTETQYRLLKSRAKDRFGRLGQRTMSRDAFVSRARVAA